MEEDGRVTIEEIANEVGIAPVPALLIITENLDLSKLSGTSGLVKFKAEMPVKKVMATILSDSKDGDIDRLSRRAGNSHLTLLRRRFEEVEGCTVKFCIIMAMPLHFHQELSELCCVNFDGKHFHILLMVQA
nr:flj37770 protein [Hymenolepis microstoma]